MDARIEASVRDWTPRTCKSGYHGLRELADAEFSGTVEARGARLFMLNGRIVGLFGGTIDAFEDVELEAQEALDPSLPLLFAMLETGGEVEAEYYTGDTSIAEVNETLSSGSFTGYVELSENVLSGDYYLIYYAGKSMSVAFVGASERLVTGDDALAKADDEVGIYKVVSVDVDLIDLPEGTAESGAIESNAGSTTIHDDAAVTGNDDTNAATDSDTVIDTDGNVETAEPDSNAGDDADTHESGDGMAVNASEPEREVAGIDDSDSTSTSTQVPNTTGEPATDAPRADENARTSDTDSNEPVDAPAAAEESARDRVDERTTAETGPDDGSSDREPRSEDAIEAEKRWQETYTIPALDPNRAASPTRAQRSAGGASTSRSDATRTEAVRTDQTADDTATHTEAPSETPAEEESMEQLNEEISTLQEQLATAQTERDDAERARDRLEQTVRELRESIERLEAAASRPSEEGMGEQSAAANALSPTEALAGTNLFVRYSSKGKPTLSDARSGAIDRKAVDENLRLERHTHFDSTAVSVDGRQFSSFLEETVEYQFVEWIVRDLLYEIQETGNEAPLRELFDAIMEIDRAEFDGSVGVRYTEDGDEHREQCSFDVVLRNPMGHPLIVANVNDSRDPATGDMLADLVTTAGLVAGTSDSFGCAIYVTASFFEPAALETAAEATSSGFFGGGSKESFVRISRKQGYHLCLVESRDGAFYVNVPEL